MGYQYGNIESKNLFERIKKTKKVYVETGTYYGGGVDYGLNHFDEVHSIEISERFYWPCVEKHRDNSRVNLYLGDSRVKLTEVLTKVNKPCFIFLDAHGDINDQGPNPLYDELNSIKNDSIKNHIIVLDDLRRMGDLNDECWSQVDIEKLKSMLVEINNDYQIFEFRDTIIAALKEDLEETETQWWEDDK